MQDIHIDVVLDPADVDDPCKHFVVEITPRWKFLKGWTLDEALDFKDKWVRFRGWMFFDRYHLKEARNTRDSASFRCYGPAGPFTCNGPGSSDIWRATAWEIHPVTSFEVLSGPPSE